eukprot:TRINITY_DN53381_c0_g1_i1.p1 TRINITY_DN53381_c0_g1~~TRINITY_DN53381_c0_g1_i1.p1  ORF type:complete len:107 (+),score=16.35 TRINITY_DN53381_c0_g1_i1:65-385(+)
MADHLSVFVGGALSGAAGAAAGGGEGNVPPAQVGPDGYTVGSPEWTNYVQDNEWEPGSIGHVTKYPDQYDLSARFNVQLLYNTKKLSEESGQTPVEGGTCGVCVLQ